MKTEEPINDTCKFCKHFKKDVEFSRLGMCQNKDVRSKLIFSFCDSFLIDDEFGCKWFEENKGKHDIEPQ